MDERQQNTIAGGSILSDMREEVGGVSYEEAANEAVRLMAAGVEWAEPRLRPDRLGEWFVSIGGAMSDATPKEFAKFAADAVRRAR
jgi:hypothetical protein